MVRPPTSTVADSPQGLVMRAARGDEAAFARIVRLHHADMVRICFAIGGDLELAEEATAATWPIAWRRLRTLREPDRLRPWLCVLAVKEARRRVLAGHRQGSSHGSPAPIDATAFDGTGLEAGLDDRLSRLADVRVKPVDIDAVAHAAKAEQVAARTLAVSVVIAAIVAALYVGAVDLAYSGSAQAVAPTPASSMAAPRVASRRSTSKA